MRKLGGIFLVLAFLLPLWARADENMNMQQPSMCMVTSEMKMCTGTWQGKGTMKDMKTGNNVTYSERLTIRPTLNDKYMMLNTVSDPDSMGNVFQGKGFSTYIPSKNEYQLFWFDSTGFGGKFEGTKQGNTITYVHEAPMGEEMILKMVMDSDTTHHMIMQMQKPGEVPVTIMNITYTKTSDTPMELNSERPVQKVQNSY